MNNLVSIIIPTRNSVTYLQNCLNSIKKQTYKAIEIIIVDGKSTDGTLKLAKQYKCKIFLYIPKVGSGSFDASYKRNYGAKKAKGAYVYWMDADMELDPTLIQEAVQLTKKGADAVILPEDSFGTGIWAQAKNLERRCYWDDDTVECPRFFKKEVWDAIGGLDESLGAGGDDLDIHQKVLDKNYTVLRTKALVSHNEGNLQLAKLFKKHFMYGRDTIRYFVKRPRASVMSYFPIRPAYLKHIDLFIQRPFDACIFIIMRTTEYFAGFLGFLYSLIDSLRSRLTHIAPTKKSKPMDIEEYARVLPQYYGGIIPKTLQKYLDTSVYNSILDCGCGDGSILSALKNKKYLLGKKTYAIDLSKNRIKLVKKIDTHIRAYVDNAETLQSILKNSIDFLYSSYVIEHVDDKKMMQAIARVMKKNGTVYISTLFKKWFGWYYKRKDGRWVMDVTHAREYSSDDELFNTIDINKFMIIESRKSQMFFPIIDFFIRRLPIKNRHIFIQNSILNALRKITVPIIGYYDWEIVLRKK